jgi:hypothetical protein
VIGWGLHLLLFAVLFAAASALFALGGVVIAAAVSAYNEHVGGSK